MLGKFKCQNSFFFYPKMTTMKSVNIAKINNFSSRNVCIIQIHRKSLDATLVLQEKIDDIIIYHYFPFPWLPGWPNYNSIGFCRLGYLKFWVWKWNPFSECDWKNAIKCNILQLLSCRHLLLPKVSHMRFVIVWKRTYFKFSISSNIIWYLVPVWTKLFFSLFLLAFVLYRHFHCQTHF